MIDILDIDSATEVRPLETPTARRSAFSLEEAIDVALRHSPARARARLDREIAAIDLEVADDRTFWDLSLDVEASQSRGRAGVRSHVKHMFARHGLSRQADLVRLVLSLAGAPESRR